MWPAGIGFIRIAMQRFSQRLLNLLHNEAARGFTDVGVGHADLFQHIKLIYKSSLSGSVEQILLVCLRKPATGEYCKNGTGDFSFFDLTFGPV
jgi:hypothetical protein